MWPDWMSSSSASVSCMPMLLQVKRARMSQVSENVLAGWDMLTKIDDTAHNRVVCLLLLKLTSFLTCLDV